MERVAILGLGLMGGSLGLALKRTAPGLCVAGYARRQQTREDALARGAVDLAFDSPTEAVTGADVVVLCVPVLRIADLGVACRAGLAAGAVVTDVGSTKGALAASMHALLEGCDASFVGSHPIAGSDKVGLNAARADLYDGRVTVITPVSDSDEAAVNRVWELWEAAGSCVVMLDPDAHDRVMARTSHLPHLVASALVAAVCREGRDAVEPFCGSGFRDSTRVAAGSEDIWHDIARTNTAALLVELKAMGKVLSDMEAMLACGDFDGLRRFLAHAGRERREMRTRE